MTPGRYSLAAIAFGVAALLVVAGYWGLAELKPFRYDKVSFERTSSCSPSTTASPRGNTVASEWKDGTLTVRTSVCANCAARVDNVTAQVMGSFVRLEIHTQQEIGMLAKCDCESPIVVRIAQVPQRDYSILGVPRYQRCF